MSGAASLNFNTQVRADLARISKELQALQQKTASGREAADLKGFGESATRLLQSRGLIELGEARSEAAAQLRARLDLQANALGTAASSLNRLAQVAREAAINDDGQFLNVDLELTFSNMVASMNESSNGQPLFGGERIGAPPVTISSLADLQGVATSADMFDEAARPQRADLGDGVSVELGGLASELSWEAFRALRDFHTLLDDAGGALPKGLTDAQKARLFDLADRLQGASLTLNAEEGRTGLLSRRLEEEQVRLEQRRTLLESELSGLTDADLAEVAVQLTALQTQYQATAQTFVTLSRLTLIDFLR